MKDTNVKQDEIYKIEEKLPPLPPEKLHL